MYPPHDVITCLSRDKNVIVEVDVIGRDDRVIYFTYLLILCFLMKLGTSYSIL